MWVLANANESTTKVAGWAGSTVKAARLAGAAERAARLRGTGGEM